MFYYFDETADQGYVDKTTSLDEYGILAGWAFPEIHKDKFEAKINEVLSSLRNRGFKKLHCTEIFRNDQNEEVREQLYQILLDLEEYIIIHEGTYSVGVKQFESQIAEHSTQIPTNTPEHIKIIKTQERTRLYTTLLTGVIAKLEEAAISEDELEVHMISDRVDIPIQEEAQQLLEELSESKRTVTAKIFNTETQKREDKSYDFEMKSSFEFKIKRVKSISYVENVNPLTFAADFICFEMLRHFRRQMKIQRPILFQSPDVLEGFRLKHKVAFLGDAYFSDLVYKPNLNG